MAKPLVTIGLVLYKGEKYLKLALESLMAQDYPNVEYLFRDQGPEGEATAFIRTQLPDIFAKIKIEKGENLMHGGGHNALMRQMKGDYYLCCSNDMLYPPDLVSKLVAEMEKPENQAVGSATPKLMFWDFEKAINCDLEGSKTNRIDSFGIAISHAHRFSEIGAGEEDLGRYDHQTSIFGSSGALSFYRKKALNDVAYINSNGSTEYYDSLLHYKNDCDLSYRLQWAGWKSLFLSMAKVWHDRFNGNQSQSPSLLVRIAKGRNDKPDWVKENSFFGQNVVLDKNFRRPGFSTMTRLKTLAFQWATFAYIVLFERKLLKQLDRLSELRGEIQAKKAAMKITVSPSEIEKLMS